MDPATVQLALSVAALLVALSFAGFVLAVGWRQHANRRIAAVIALEAMLFTDQPMAVLESLGVDAGGVRTATAPLPWMLASAYLWFLTTLGTRLLRPLDSRPGRVALLAYPVLVTAATWRWKDDIEVMGPLIGLHVLFVAVVGLVVGIVALRSTAPGTIARSRARWFLAAFGTRDAIHALTIVAALGLGVLLRLEWDFFALLVLGAIVVYVPLLAYGILRTQLFDIDLRIKVGIRRGTVVSIILVLVFVAAKVAESYLSRTMGVVAGSAAAGVLLFLVPKLNKLGEKVATTAMPKVEPTSRYVEFRKMEVYRAAVESAHETGEVTAKERASLERLRVKLAIAQADAEAIEADVGTALAARPPPRSAEA